QSRAQHLARISAHDQQGSQMMQHQMLQAMYEEHALGVVIDTRVQRQVKKSHAYPETELAGKTDPMDAAAPQKEPDARKKHQQQRRGELPGRQPINDYHEQDSISASRMEAPSRC